MTLAKDFLSNKYQIQPKNWLAGLSLWLLSSYILYAWFQLIREVFRILTSDHGDNVLLILTSKENYLYNLFYAGLAVALGYMWALNFTLQNSTQPEDWRTRTLIRRTQTISGHYTWSFLLWFAKLGSILGITYLWFAMQYELSFIRDTPLALILIPMVLFYASWPNFSRVVRTRKAWWFIRLTIIFLVMSFGFAFKNFSNYQKVNQHLLSKSIQHVHDLQVATSVSQHKVRRWGALHIYLVRDTVPSNAPIFYFNSIDKPFSLGDLPQLISRAKGIRAEVERERLTANLHVDKHIPRAQVEKLLHELRKADLISIQYATAQKYSSYPTHYPGFKYWGIPARLKRYYPRFQFYLDSVERIDLRGKKLKLSESLMYRQGWIDQSNRIRIDVAVHDVTLNGQVVDSVALKKYVYKFMKKYATNYVIIFNSADDISHARYIAYLDIIWTQGDRLKNEAALASFGKPFNELYGHGQQGSIRRLYPMNIIEWTLEEKRLNELIRVTEANETF